MIAIIPTCKQLFGRVVCGAPATGYVTLCASDTSIRIPTCDDCIHEFKCKFDLSQPDSYVVAR